MNVDAKKSVKKTAKKSESDNLPKVKAIFDSTKSKYAGAHGIGCKN